MAQPAAQQFPHERVYRARPLHQRVLMRAGAAAGLSVAAAAVWAFAGPLRAGDGSARTAQSRLSTSAVGSARTPVAAGVGSPTGYSASNGAVPVLPFSAVLNGSLTQTGPDLKGQVTVSIRARVSGAMAGALDIVLRGTAAGSGVTLATSTVAFGPTGSPTRFRGQVVVLNGEQMVARVTDGSSSALDLGVDFKIDPASGSVTGVLQAQSAAATGDGRR